MVKPRMMINPGVKESLLSRRRFLGTAGTLVALPFLDSLLPRGARAAASASPKRLVVWTVPNGLYMNQWTPATAGSQFEITPLLAPFTALKGDIMVLTNTRNRAAESPNFPCDHARGTGSMLTGTSIRLGSSLPAVAAISMDQVAAKTLGAATVYASLQLGLSIPGPDAGAADNGVAPTYNHAVTWADGNTPIQPQTQPSVVFNSLFAGSNSAKSAADAALRQQYKTSVLDSALAQMQSLNAKLSSSDQAKLDQYATGVRELEVQVNKTAPACVPGQAPASVAAGDTQSLSTQMIGIMTLALRCDMTRVITFMAGPPEADRVYPFLNLAGGHHNYTHQGPNSAVQTINLWEMQQVAAFLQALKATPDGTGTLLDNVAFMMTSEIRGTDDAVGGGDHSHSRMPMLLAGRSGGALLPGRHIVFPTGDAQPDFTQLHLTLLRGLGVPATSFAGATSPLSQLATV